MEDLRASLSLGRRNASLTTAVTVEEKGEGEMKVPRFACHDLEERLPGLGVSCPSGGNIGGICRSLTGEAGCELPPGEVAFESSMTESAESVLSPLGGTVGP